MTIKEFKIQYALGSLSHIDLIKLASNKRTSKRVLTMLANDQNWGIKSHVAGNPNTPIKVLNKLSLNISYIISSNAAYNLEINHDIKRI